MLRVSITEDEEMIRRGLVYTTGWPPMDCVVVAEAADGRGGYGKILRHRPDVVITDIYMPFTDGVETIKKVLEQVRFKNTFLTSYTDFGYTRCVIEARVCEYLLKPVDEKTLAGIIERLGEKIVGSRQVEHVIEQTEIEGGNSNLEYYMQLNLSGNQHVSRAITVIQEDFVRKLSIESVPDDLGVSTSYLSRKSGEVTRQTLLDFPNRYKVQQAIVMLGIRQYRISEILEAIGFTDYRHFRFMFKKYTSKLPTKFIKGVS